MYILNTNIFSVISGFNMQKEDINVENQSQGEDVNESNGKLQDVDRSEDQTKELLESHVNLDDDATSVETAYDESLHPDTPKDLSDSMPSLIDESQGPDSPIRDRVSDSLNPKNSAGKDLSPDGNSALQHPVQKDQVDPLIKNKAERDLLFSDVNSGFFKQVQDDLQIVSKFWEGVST